PAKLVCSGLGRLVLLGYLASPWSAVRLSFRSVRIRWALFWEILRVGAPGSLNTVMTNLTVVLVTGLVGPFGTLALAGYGMGARLEYLQIPLVFGMGSALVAMVGTNVGAGRIARAVRASPRASRPRSGSWLPPFPACGSGSSPPTRRPKPSAPPIF